MENSCLSIARGKQRSKHVVGFAILTLLLVAPASAQIIPSPPELLNTNADSDIQTDTEPSITTDRAGNWVAVWRSAEDLNGTADTDHDIFISRSGDLGMTWTPPELLNSTGIGNDDDDNVPMVVTDRLGSWVTVWRSAGIQVDTEIFVARSSDNGGTWSQAQLLSMDSEDFPPVLAADGLGNWIIVWQTEENFDGTAGTEGDIAFVRSVDNGASWSSPALLNTNGDSDTSIDTNPAIAADGNGNWVVAWSSTEDLNGTAGNDGDIFVARSTDAGATWTAPIVVTDNTGLDDKPELVADGDGNWLIVWESSDTLGGTVGGDTDLLAARSTDNGASWSAPVLVNTTGDSDTEFDGDPAVATDGLGNWVCAWMSGEDFNGTSGTDDDILAAQSTDGGMTWSDPVLVNTNGNTDSGDDSLPAIASDGDGNWLVIWDTRNDIDGAGSLDGDIVVTRFSLDPAPSSISDLNDDGVVNAVDVQLVINGALGLDIGSIDADVNGDSAVNAVDVQTVINAALGL